MDEKNKTKSPNRWADEQLNEQLENAHQTDG